MRTVGLRRIAASLAVAAATGVLVTCSPAGAATMTMSMTPTVVAEGHDVTVSSVTPCEPGESVAVLFNAPPNTTEADTTANAAGGWSATFTVPLWVPPGSYGVQAACSPLGAFREYEPLTLTVKLAVNLQAYPVVYGKGLTLPNLKAALTTVMDGRGVAGAAITFTNLKHKVLCTGTTDATGTATCTGGYRSLSSGGYYAIYAGDPTHLGATAKGHAVGSRLKF